MMNFTSYLNVMVLKNLEYQAYQKILQNYRCSTLKMSRLLNTNDRKLIIKVAKFVYFGMKEYTFLPDFVSEEIDNVDLNCLYD